MVEHIPLDIKVRPAVGHSKWLEDLISTYPLPAAPSHQCRDAFLKDLLEPFKPPEKTESIEDEDSDKQVQFGRYQTELSESFNVERDLFNYMEKTRRATTHRSTVASQRESRIQAPDLFKLMKGRYDRVSSAVGHLAVILGLRILQDRLRTVLEMWPVSVSVDKSYNMFSWSIQDYITRFNMPNQTYLDITERELKDQMDCFKFRMDVSETIRLVYAVDDDIRSKRDICDNSMLLIEDAQTDIMELVTTFKKNAEEGYLDAATAAHRTPRSADPQHAKMWAIQAKYNYDDFVYPIEARYRIKWAQTQVEQAVMYSDCFIKELSKEVIELTEGYTESKLFWECSQIAFEQQIHALKGRITDFELAYDKKMEIIANDREILQNKLLKAKEELASNRERIPMFHLRIEEVKDLIAKQEAEEMNEMNRIGVSSRPLKKKSLNNRKSGDKKKKSLGNKKY